MFIILWLFSKRKVLAVNPASPADHSTVQLSAVKPKILALVEDNGKQIHWTLNLRWVTTNKPFSAFDEAASLIHRDFVCSKKLS